MVMSNRTIHVTSAPFDVYNCVMDTTLVIHACKSRRSTAKAVLATQRRENKPQHIGRASLLLPNVQDSGSCQARMRKRAKTLQEENRAEEDGRHVEGSLLSENEGGRGAKRSSGDVGSEQREF